MKRIILLLSLLGLQSKYLEAQITKGNWLLGGNVSFSNVVTTDNAGSSYTTSTFTITPNAGYFFIDKLCGGVKAGYENYRTKYQFGSASGTSSFLVGPFLRYYFLPIDNNVNLFSELGYEYSQTENNGATREDIFNFSGGASWFLNSSVAVEFTATYSIQKVPLYKSNMIQFGLGFQFYLEKK